jgi:antirestriction protein ArdC
VHSTGHSSRLNRKSLYKVEEHGDHSYSFEELVAEIGSAMLCGLAGIAPVTLDNSAAYIASWLHRLKDDKTWVLHAAAQAQKATDRVVGTGKEAKGM